MVNVRGVDKDRAADDEGVQEAVRNVERHARVKEATLRAVPRDDGTIAVELRDAGCGFDAARVPAHRRGLSESIVGRMERAGGRAVADSRPGEGTVVRWTWPVAGAGEAARRPEANGPSEHGSPGPATWTRERLLSAFRGAVLTVAVVVQGFCLVQIVANRAHYQPLWPQIAAFVLLILVAAVGAYFVLVRGSTLPPAIRWAGVGLVVLASLAASVPLADGARLWPPVHWSFGLVGWYALFLLSDFRLAVFAGFLGVHLTLTATGMAVAGPPGVGVLATVGITAVLVCGFQYSVGMVAGLLCRIADSATRAADEHERLRTRAAISENMRHDERRRSLALADTTVPLLAELADGSLDPHDPDTRGRCALEAARMRRLFAEYDDVPDRLVHELRAAIDIAERNGVTVQLAVRGQAFELPRDVRRALLDPVSAVLASAESTARATVVRTQGMVRVSAVGDTCGSALELAAAPATSETAWGHFQISSVTAGCRLWTETIWRPAEPSRSP